MMYVNTQYVLVNVVQVEEKTAGGIILSNTKEPQLDARLLRGKLLDGDQNNSNIIFKLDGAYRYRSNLYIVPKDNILATEARETDPSEEKNFEILGFVKISG